MNVGYAKFQHMMRIYYHIQNGFLKFQKQLHRLEHLLVLQKSRITKTLIMNKNQKILSDVKLIDMLKK